MLRIGPFEDCTGPFTLLFDEDWLTVDNVTWRNNATDWLWYFWQGEDDAADDSPLPDDGNHGSAVITNNTIDGGTHVTLIETTRLVHLTLTNTVFAHVTIDTAQTAFILNPYLGGTLSVANNLFYDIDDLDPYGGRLFSGDPDLRNNIVMECDMWNVLSFEADYSIFWDNGVDYAPLVTGVGNLFGVDPELANPAGWDFTPLAGSPAIDAGDPDPVWNDADGTRNDIGVTGG